MRRIQRWLKFVTSQSTKPPTSGKTGNSTELERIIHNSKAALWLTCLFSFATNILMLTGPLFMLQVYDRVLTSRSVETLIALFSLVAVLYLFVGVLEFIRSTILSRLGYRLEIGLLVTANRNWIASGVNDDKAGSRPLNDLSVVRRFTEGGGLPALFDLPWIPVYLLIVFLLHNWLGMLAMAGALLVIAAAAFAELKTRRALAGSAEFEQQDYDVSESSRKNADAILAMGMTRNVTRNMAKTRLRALELSQRAGWNANLIASATKSLRLLLQSSILALGAYLAIHQEITAGVMIAASILAGRALAPVDAIVGNWKQITNARLAYRRLQGLFARNNDRRHLQLPKPAGKLNVVQVTKVVGDQKKGQLKPILNGIHFHLEPGDGLGVIGQSASGKTSLAKVLVGLSNPDRGEVRLDGATLEQWNQDAIGAHRGYLPQNVQLIAGTVAENISRFSSNPKTADIIAAAKLAGIHEMILKLPDGYSTDLGQSAAVLTGGQTQQVALARAVFGSPALVVLDEPNANLDLEGEASLTKTIARLRRAGSIVVVMAHRPSAFAAVNKLLVLKNGIQTEFGKTTEVLARVSQHREKPHMSVVSQ